MTMNHQWHHISHYSDGALRRMAKDTRDLRSDAARRELERRTAEEAHRG